MIDDIEVKKKIKIIELTKNFFLKIVRFRNYWREGYKRKLIYFLEKFPKKMSLAPGKTFPYLAAKIRAYISTPPPSLNGLSNYLF